MKRFSFLLALVLSVPLFNSCFERKEPTMITATNIIILNQGNYSEQNASISLYSEDSLKVWNRVFESANNISLGAVLQGGAVDKYGTLYLLCSNPEKIVVADALTLKQLGTITNHVSTPRAISIYNDLIFVTNYGTNSVEDEFGWYSYPDSYIAIYSNSGYSLITTIDVGTNAEGVFYYNNSLYVATSEGVKVIDLALNNISKVISDAELGAPKYFVYGSDGNIYASYPGYGLAAINPSTKEIVGKYPMQIDYDGYITTNANRTEIYSYCASYDAEWNPTSTLNKFTISDGNSTTILNGTYFYNIGVSPFTDRIYTTETSFTSNSTLKVFDKEMNSIDEQTVGVGTYRYIFYQATSITTE